MIGHAVNELLIYNNYATISLYLLTLGVFKDSLITSEKSS